MSELLQDLARFKTAFAFAGLFALLVWETFAPFFSMFSGDKERVRHLVRNVAMGAINAVAIGFVFSVLWLGASEYVWHRDLGLLHWLRLPALWHLLAAILLLDLWMYWWHWANHRLPFFWRFHRMHHSDRQMDVTTASRFHLGEIVLSSLLRIPVIMILGVELWELLIYETMMFAVVQMHHANVGVPVALDRVLRCVIVTPSLHKVHHSREWRETNSNFGSLFSWWDRLFRSLRISNDPQKIRFGIDGIEEGLSDQLGGMLKTPFLNLPNRWNDPAPAPTISRTTQSAEQ